MTYHGGPIQQVPAIYVTYWGWASDPRGEQPYLNNFLSGIGSSAWLNTLVQYTESKRGHITNPAGQLAGTWSDSNPVPTTPTQSDIANEAAASAAHFGWNADADYVVATPTGHSTSGFGTQFCAWHSVLQTTGGLAVAYTNLPYQTDAGASCGANLNGGGPLAGVSIVGGHEIAEVQTDPQISAWYDGSNAEVGDKCAWGINGAPQPQVVAFSTGRFSVQPLWSNNDSGCIFAPTPWPSTSGPAVAVDSSGQQLVFFRGPSGNIEEAWYAAGGWNGPVDEGPAWAAAAGSAPAVAVTSGQQIVFFEGANGTIHEAWYASGRWNGPVDEGPQWAATSGPAVAVDSSGQQIVFFRGTNGTIHEAWYAGSWNGPVDQGWPVAAGTSPGVAVTGGTQIVFFEGSNGTIHEAWYASGRWNGPVDEGNAWAATSGPGVAADSSGTQLVFFRGSNGTVHEAWFTGSWNGPVDEGSAWATAAGSAPAVGVTTGQQLVFFRGPDGDIHEAWYASGRWNGPVLCTG